MNRANLHPNPLSGYSEDYPDPVEDTEPLEPVGSEATPTLEPKPMPTSRNVEVVVSAEEHTPEWAEPELERLACSAQEGYQNPVAQVAFRAGFLLCREYMARFVEQGGDASTAASIRANWMPAFGADPGPPRKYDFAEVAEADDMENGPWRPKNPGPSVDAAVYALCVMHDLGMSPPHSSEDQRLSPSEASASSQARDDQ